MHFDKTTVEPVFGQIKEARGIRGFRLRGLLNVTSEWKLICATNNLLKLFRHRMTLAHAYRPGQNYLLPHRVNSSHTPHRLLHAI
jgi:hypothetical protein